MVDPFKILNTADLINISTGEKAPSNELVDARAKGLQTMKSAEEQGLTTINHPKMITFAPKKTKSTTKQKLSKIYRDESDVTRALCFVQGAGEGTQHEAFSHEWTCYPSSIFEPSSTSEQDYVMRTGSKRDFLLPLLTAADIQQPLDLPNSDLPTVYIIDAVAFILRYQQLGAKTFGELITKYVSKDVNTQTCWMHTYARSWRSL